MPLTTIMMQRSSSAMASTARPVPGRLLPHKTTTSLRPRRGTSAGAASGIAPAPAPSSPLPASSSTTTTATVIAPPPPLAAAASVSTAPPRSPGDPEVFPPVGMPGELAGEWERSVAAVSALLERAAAEGASTAAAAPAPARRRRGGGREEEDAPPELAAQRHVARAFGWGSQAYWRHSVVGAAPDAGRVERALAFLVGGDGGGGGADNDEAESRPPSEAGGQQVPLGFSAPEAAAVLKSFPELLFLDAEARLGANAAQLRRQWRLEGAVLRGAVARNPRALGYDFDCQGTCMGDCHRCWARF